MTDQIPVESLTDEPGDSAGTNGNENPTPSTVPFKLLSGSYSALAVVGIGVFFLPWVSISCQGVVMYSQTGYEVTKGTLTENKNFAQEAAQKFGALGKAGGGKLDVGGAGRQRQMPSKKDTEKDLSGFWGLAFMPLGLLLVATFGPISFLANRPVRPLVPLIGAALATLAMLACVVGDLPFERQLTAQDENIAKLLNLERSSNYTIAVRGRSDLCGSCARCCAIRAASRRSTQRVRSCWQRRIVICARFRDPQRQQPPGENQH